MPRLLLMSAFGDSELAQNMVYFLEHLEQAEHTLTEKDLRLLSNISVKDRGPILYWLINERASCPPLAAPATLGLFSTPVPLVVPTAAALFCHKLFSLLERGSAFCNGRAAA